MRPYFLIALLVFSHPAVASETVMSMQSGKVTVRLMQPQCSAPTVLARIKPEVQHLFQKARVLWQGKWLNACWTLLPTEPGGPAVLIVDETGDNGTLPISAFKPEENV